jgi:hypothetical protein
MLDAPRSRKSALSVIKLSKTKYYLVDNIYCLMLSQLIGRVQEESERDGGRFRRVIANGRGHCGAKKSGTVPSVPKHIGGNSVLSIPRHSR